MADPKTTTLERLLDIYSHQYDLDREGVYGGGVFPATATYFLRDENYLISKKHVLSAVENYDYLYFCPVDHLDAPTLERVIEASMELGRERVRPHREHMSSFITLIILADTMDQEAKALVKKTRMRKYFKFAFHGWMEYRIAALELSTNEILSNPAGRDVRKLLEQNFGMNTSKKGGFRK
ncbi:MAG: hypothetical protein IKU62_00245 [Ruminiclostridium sp.]|nr:hypothetical protein [Ruminiclostridium sp.]